MMRPTLPSVLSANWLRREVSTILECRWWSAGGSDTDDTDGHMGGSCLSNTPLPSSSSHDSPSSGVEFLLGCLLWLLRALDPLRDSSMRATKSSGCCGVLYWKTPLEPRFGNFLGISCCSPWLQIILFSISSTVKPGCLRGLRESIPRASSARKKNSASTCAQVMSGSAAHFPTWRATKLPFSASTDALTQVVVLSEGVLLCDPLDVAITMSASEPHSPGNTSREPNEVCPPNGYFLACFFFSMCTVQTKPKTSANIHTTRGPAIMKIKPLLKPSSALGSGGRGTCRGSFGLETSAGVHGRPSPGSKTKTCTSDTSSPSNSSASAITLRRSTLSSRRCSCAASSPDRASTRKAAPTSSDLLAMCVEKLRTRRGSTGMLEARAVSAASSLAPGGLAAISVQRTSTCGAGTTVKLARTTPDPPSTPHDIAERFADAARNSSLVRGSDAAVPLWHSGSWSSRVWFSPRASRLTIWTVK
mmetsp:Transcript_64008/g.133467  ORF Transcript_64008/g.133467 Transcript_64008/m.133467 type:complete len:475 (-) Transcript_64008:25-1449(-)